MSDKLRERDRLKGQVEMLEKLLFLDVVQYSEPEQVYFTRDRSGAIHFLLSVDRRKFGVKVAK
jgi:hypothetical protein